MTGSALAAELLAGLAGALLLPDRGRAFRRLAVDPAARTPRRPRWWGAGPLTGVVVWVASGSVVVAAAGGLLSLVVVRQLRARRLRAREAAVRAAGLDLVTAFAGELRAGSEPRAALATVGGSPRAAAFGAVAAAARSPGADPAEALARVAGAHGCALLGDLAAAWRVAAETGAPLAGVAARLAASARAEEAVRRELAAQLAGPRATALLLTGLPVVGLLLGAALGADPMAFLLGTAAGRCCLLAGVALVAAGTAWTEAIVSRAEGP